MEKDASCHERSSVRLGTAELQRIRAHCGPEARVGIKCGITMTNEVIIRRAIIGQARRDVDRYVVDNTASARHISHVGTYVQGGSIDLCGRMARIGIESIDLYGRMAGIGI